MINSQEVIERSIYTALLNTAVKMGYSLDPEDFLPISPENAAKYEAAMKEIPPDQFIYVFGTGNNQAKGAKKTPRIVVNSKGFFPGAVGMPRQLLQKEEGIGFTATEFPYEALDQFIDIHLVASNQDHMRLLHQIMFWSIPQRGYLKPYTEDSFLFTGNIFMEVTNFYDRPVFSDGIMEKVYEFIIYDCIIGERDNIPTDLVPIRDISLLLENYGEEPLIEISSKEQQLNKQ